MAVTVTIAAVATLPRDSHHFCHYACDNQRAWSAARQRHVKAIDLKLLHSRGVQTHRNVKLLVFQLPHH